MEQSEKGDWMSERNKWNGQRKEVNIVEKSEKRE